MAKKKDNFFPNEKTLKRMRDKLSDNSVMGSSVLPENASEIDKTKYKACELIVKFVYKKKLKQKEVATKLGVDESRMSEILHYKIENYTLERLLGYAKILYPNLKIELLAA